MKKNGKVKIVGIIVVFLLFAGIYTVFGKNHEAAPGLFIWNMTLEEDSIQKVEDAVSEFQVGEVYCSFVETDGAEKSPEQLIEKMSEQNASVWYLAGEAEWGLDPEGEELCQVIVRTAEYNASVGEKGRFAGVVADIEPYSLEEWEEDRQAVMKSWCEGYRNAKRCAKENNLLLTICIPRWLDEIDSGILEQMINEGCDRVAVMNYGKKNEIEKIAKEIELADKYDKPVIHISELQEPGQFELTDNETYYHSGLEAVHDSWEGLRKSFPKSNLQFAYHELESLLEMKKKK